MTRRGFISLAACATLRGQTSQQRGKEIIDRAIDGIGGDAFRYLSTVTATGQAYSFYREEITGLSTARIVTKYYPDQMKQRQMFGKKFDDIVLLTNKSAWEITYRGARDLGEERVKTFNETTTHDIFYILRVRIQEPGMVFEAHGIDVVENQPVYTIEIYDSENRNMTVWFHQDTYLPVKQRFSLWDTVIKDRHEEVSRYTKYRNVGNGVMWPHDIQRERDQSKTYELYADNVTAGDVVADDEFDLPQGVKIWKPK
ncbi:MAG: hypothetical protein KGN84_03830 [Acidobacteriota bacterium]|nr:hypothetical protein [Acidobacteriota bacterium]